MEHLGVETEREREGGQTDQGLGAWLLKGAFIVLEEDGRLG